ncbi:hypothetical protein NBRC116595_10210 [Aliiglaciecola sp. NS0011-25]
MQDENSGDHINKRRNTIYSLKGKPLQIPTVFHSNIRITKSSELIKPKKKTLIEKIISFFLN